MVGIVFGILRQNARMLLTHGDTEKARCSALAAYLLDAWILLGLDIVAAIAWLATVFAVPTPSTAS